MSKELLTSNNRSQWADRLARCHGGTWLDRGECESLSRLLSVDSPPATKPARDADHCDYPDCEQHNTLVVERLLGKLRSMGVEYSIERNEFAQCVHETRVLFTLDAQANDLLDEHGRPYHPDMELSWRTYLGNCGPQPQAVRSAYISAWYAGRAERSAQETNETSEAWLFECSRPGDRMAYASVYKDDTGWWPRDQWKLVTRTSLLSRGQREVLWGDPPAQETSLSTHMRPAPEVDCYGSACEMLRQMSAQKICADPGGCAYADCGTGCRYRELGIGGAPRDNSQCAWPMTHALGCTCGAKASCDRCEGAHATADCPRAQVKCTCGLKGTYAETAKGHAPHCAVNGSVNSGKS